MQQAANGSKTFEKNRNSKRKDKSRFHDVRRCGKAPGFGFDIRISDFLACSASRRGKLSKIGDWPLTCESGSYENAAHLRSEGKVMERTVAWLGVALPEQVLFLLKSGVFLCASGVILYVALASSYPGGS